MSQEEGRKNKEEEEDKQNRIFVFCFLDLLKVSGTYRVDLAVEYLRDVDCKLFSLLYFFFLGTALIPYVQAAILDLHIPN